MMGKKASKNKKGPEGVRVSKEREEHGVGGVLCWLAWVWYKGGCICMVCVFAHRLRWLTFWMTIVMSSLRTIAESTR